MNEQRNFFIIFFIVFAAFWGYEYFFPHPVPVENAPVLPNISSVTGPQYFSTMPAGAVSMANVMESLVESVAVSRYL